MLSLSAMLMGGLLATPGHAAPILRTVHVSPTPTPSSLEPPVLSGEPAEDFDAFIAAGFQYRLFKAGIGELLEAREGREDPVSRAIIYDLAARDWLAAHCYDDVGSQTDQQLESIDSLDDLRSAASGMEKLIRRTEQCMSASNRLAANDRRLRVEAQWELETVATVSRRWALDRARSAGFEWAPPHRPSEASEADMRENLDSLAQAMEGFLRIVDTADLWRGQEEFTEAERNQIRDQLARLHTEGRDGRSLAVWSIDVVGEPLEFRYDKNHEAWRVQLFSEPERTLHDLEDARQTWGCLLGDFTELHHKQGKDWESFLVWPRPGGAHLGLDLGYRERRTTVTLAIIPSRDEVDEGFLVQQLNRHHLFDPIGSPKTKDAQLVCE